MVSPPRDAGRVGYSHREPRGGLHKSGAATTRSIPGGRAADASRHRCPGARGPRLRALISEEGEKNTTTRQGDASPAKPSSSSRIGENGTRVVVEHDDSDSEDGHSDLGHANHAQNYSIEGWEDDEDWNEAHDDEDLTIRQALDSASLEEDEEMRGAVNLYRAKDERPGAGSGLAGGKTRRKGQGQFDMDVDNTPQPEVEESMEDSEEEEADFPEVKLDELLEDFDEMTIQDREE